MIDLISKIIIFIGLVFISFGVISSYRFKNFYSRALMASKIDTVGFILILSGLIIRHRLSVFSLKLLLLIIIGIIINPIVTHAIVRSAYISGYMTKKRSEK